MNAVADGSLDDPNEHGTDVARSYRLQQIEAGLRVFEEKYGMAFEEYRQRWETDDREEDYQWEVEQDFLHWEALVTQKRRLEGVVP